MSHEPYVASEPPQSNRIEDFREWLAFELRRVENAFNGVDLEVETRWDDLRIPATSQKAGGVADPTWAQLLSDGSGSTGIFIWKFPVTGEKELFFYAQFPHTKKAGSDVYPHLHWTTDATASAGEKVVWGLEWSYAQLGAQFPNSTIYTLTATATLQPRLHVLNSLGTITATGSGPSAMVIGRVFRDPTSGGDNYGGNACLIEVDFHYEKDNHGGETQS